MAILICRETGFKVVGYFAYNDFGEVFCSEDACIVAGSEELMKKYWLSRFLCCG